MRSRPNPQWFNSSIRHQINCLKTLRRKNRYHPSPLKSSKIKQLEEQLQKGISSAKSEFESQLLLSLHSCGSSKVFRYVYNITGQNAIPYSIHLGDISSESDNKKADLLNFYSVFTRSSFCLPNPHELPHINPKLGDLSITEEDIIQVQTSLDPSKAAGCDGIVLFV